VSILKAPPKQSKNATLQVRIDEDLKAKLEKYAEFLDTTAAYVVSEALELVFNKDAEFKEWLEKQQANDIPSDGERAPVTAMKHELSAMTEEAASHANGKRLLFK
jgi:predicted transcriptional regulator